MISIYFALSPLDERHQLDEGDVVDERDVHRLYVLHRRAAKATPLLLADGWTVWFTEAGLEADHPDVGTRVEAEARLIGLGIPVAWVEVLGTVTDAEDGSAN